MRAGEILGLAGLAGCRRSELADTIFGLTPADAGEIRIHGAAVRHDTPSAAIRSGIGYVPKDRRQHGVVARDVDRRKRHAGEPAKSIPSRDWSGTRRRTAVAEEFISRLAIKAPSSDTGVAALSGGNQQKVALARWLMTGARVLILDEPTQGVDVCAKAEIHALIVDLAEQGAAILMISSELPELLGMSDRIAVMHDGTDGRRAGPLRGERALRCWRWRWATDGDARHTASGRWSWRCCCSAACWRSSRPVISRAPT